MVTLEYHLHVPIAFMGGLIGMGGETVKKLQNDSECEFRIAPKEKTELRSVILVGSNIPVALEMMFELFKEEITKAAQGALAPKNLTDVFTFKISVAVNQVGAIIGKGGKGVEQLREQFKCSVKVKGQGDVELSGTVDAIKGATLGIWQQISTVLPSRLPPTSTMFAGPEIEVELIMMDETIGMLIGKRGETISQIRKQSRGVMIEIPSEKVDGKRRIKLKGTCGATARAHQVIATHIEEDERRKKRRDQATTASDK
eukprot:GEMP01013855.1.p1 GENE.GEMP01013855.1~~GEMP01013855.1.p1  ORF type:complete len:257 (+),score=47.19 GEMP01013855.1:57-827(+)